MAGAAVMPGSVKRPLVAGVQLYTIRDIVRKRPLETLQAIADIGYREVEMLRSQVEPLAPYLKRVDLQPISMHFETPLLTGNWSAWQHADMPPIEAGVTFNDAVSVARDHGFQYIVFNYLSPEERLGLDFYRALAEKLNAAGQKCQSAGLRFCYHNHDFEFEPKPGGRPIDTLLAGMDRKLVGLEVDTFWVSMAGVDAAAFLRQHSGWVDLVHLKDRAKGTPVHYDIATVPNDTYRELGNGDLPLENILRAAAESGAKHYFVEQDFSTDPIRSLRQSYTFLKKSGVLSARGNLTVYAGLRRPHCKSGSARGTWESAVVYDLVAALKSQITVQDGRAVQSNFNKFSTLQMNETSSIQVHIVPSELTPTGIGERAASCCAGDGQCDYFAVTSKRIRRLPLQLAT